MKTRVRFAPSPTGPLHVGGLRTALFNYLYAKKKGGSFILRIEDTDQSRLENESEAYIQKALEWCGLDPDEGPKKGGDFGPYKQSKRQSIYKDHIQQLLNSGGAYYAFDLPENLEKERKKAEAIGETFFYGNQNRMTFLNSLTLNKSETQKALKSDYVIRLKVPSDKEITVYDKIRGPVKVKTNLLDDKILMKSDGMPTYHFANVIDDRLMKISTVIRGEEWLPSLPIHKLIYDAFKWDTPEFMHLPLILKPTGKGKLSKRDAKKNGFPLFPFQYDDSAPGFYEMGFLPQGLTNYLSSLGWNDSSEREVFCLDELVKIFNVKGIQKGGARFDYEKARWINHQHIFRAATKKLINYPLIKNILADYPEENHLKILALFKERLYTLNDLKDEVVFLRKPYDYDEKAISALDKKNSLISLRKIYNLIEESKENESFKKKLFDWAKVENIPIKAVLQSFRLSLVGRLTGPDLFEACALLGKNVSLKRVSEFIKKIK